MSGSELCYTWGYPARTEVVVEEVSVSEGAEANVAASKLEQWKLLSGRWQ